MWNHSTQSVWCVQTVPEGCCLHMWQPYDRSGHVINQQQRQCHPMACGAMRRTVPRSLSPNKEHPIGDICINGGSQKDEILFGTSKIPSSRPRGLSDRPYIVNYALHQNLVVPQIVYLCKLHMLILHVLSFLFVEISTHLKNVVIPYEDSPKPSARPSMHNVLPHQQYGMLTNHMRTLLSQ